jgi:division protein CdvB (Snf7/Vps24/ESCRT-III family)
MKPMDKYPLLKSKLDNASRVVNNQLTKLRMLDNRFNTLDTDLHNKVIVNIKNGDKLRAKALANELANIRKIKNTTQKLLLSLEVIVIRFSTISEFAEILDTINPMIATIKEVKDDVKNTIPTATNIISEMSTLTSDVLIQSNVNLNFDTISVPVNPDAIEILSEVQNIMEEETRLKLPDIPNSITNKNKSSYKKNEETSNKNFQVLLEA